MKFELKDYHRNITNEELINDVIITAQKLNKSTLTTVEYDKNGSFSQSTLTKRFGSWKKVLKLSGLKTISHSYKFNYTDDEIITDLRRVAEELGVNTLTAREYNQKGFCHSSTLIKKYGCWNKVLKLAGMKPKLNRNFSNENMFEEIERVWIELGRQPTTTDIKKGISKYSLNSYARRFGGWREALEAFIQYINKKEPTSEECIDGLNIGNVNLSCNKEVVHKTNRDINLRLRFKVMQRDNFKCCMCGASPAKDPSIVLHIDHIIPWSKGGETVINNLQTLCSKCNLGKSDLL